LCQPNAHSIENSGVEENGLIEPGQVLLAVQSATGVMFAGSNGMPPPSAMERRR